MQASIVPIEGEELLMGSLLDDTSTVDDTDQVGMDDRGEAMGDDDRRAPGHEAVEGTLHQTFTLGI